VDSPDVSKNFAEKIAGDGKGKSSFPLLSDPGHKIIDAYGLQDPAYKGQNVDGIPHPAVYIINEDGKVIWAKIESNYRKRPTNDELRAVLNTLE
jgi:peroxiredoxin